MAKVSFELDRAGVRELMMSDEMANGLSALAGEIVARLGDGYSASLPYKGENRVNVEVSADTYAARRENASNNTILKAVQG